MDPLQALALGVLQGLTEFLPISSSGHLVIVPELLGWPLPPVIYDATVHVGTLLAVAYLYRRDLAQLLRAGLTSLWRRRLDDSSRLAWLIVAATLPGVAIGFVFQEPIEALFASPRAAGVLLLVTAALLITGEQLNRRVGRVTDPGLAAALLIGLAQALAVAPGISRSGATIAAGLMVGLSRPGSARFSFLLAVPILLGAAILQGAKLIVAAGPSPDVAALALGFVAALASGMLAIRWLLRYLSVGSLYPFAAYVALFGLLTLAVTR